MVFSVFRVSFSQGEKEQQKITIKMTSHTISHFCPLWTMSAHRENFVLRDLTQKCDTRLISWWFSTLVIKYTWNIHCVPITVLGLGKYSWERLFLNSLYLRTAAAWSDYKKYSRWISQVHEEQIENSYWGIEENFRDGDIFIEPRKVEGREQRKRISDKATASSKVQTEDSLGVSEERTEAVSAKSVGWSSPEHLSWIWLLKHCRLHQEVWFLICATQATIKCFWVAQWYD